MAPGARDLATAAEDAPPTQFRPSFGLGKPAVAVAKHHLVSSGAMFKFPEEAMIGGAELCVMTDALRNVDQFPHPCVKNERGGIGRCSL